MQIDKKIIYIIILVIGIPLFIFLIKKEIKIEEYGTMQEKYSEETVEVEEIDNAIYEREVLDSTRMPHGAIYRLQGEFNSFLKENGVYGEIFEISAVNDARGEIRFLLTSQSHKYHALYKKEEDMFLFSK